MCQFEGVFPYIVSAVYADGTICREVMGTLCDDLIQKEVHRLARLGSTDEFAYLNRAQKGVVVQTVVKFKWSPEVDKQES